MDDDFQELIKHPALALAHRIRAPRSRPMAGAPCLLLLHGVGSNELAMMELAAAVDPRFAVVLVRAPIQFGPMQFAFFQVGFTVGGPQINPAQAESSRHLLASFVTALPEVYGIDPRRIWIAGFSQGGIMSASIGLTHPGLVQGFGVLSGRILSEIGPLTASPARLAGTRAFVSHGLRDPILSVEFARSARTLLERLGIALTYGEFPGGHALTAAMQEQFQGWLTGELGRGQDAGSGT